MYKLLRKQEPVSNFRLNRFLIKGPVLISKFAFEPEKFPGLSRNGLLICPNVKLDSKRNLALHRGGGVLLGILGGGVPAGSPNPDPISDQKI